MVYNVMILIAFSIYFSVKVAWKTILKNFCCCCRFKNYPRVDHNETPLHVYKYASLLRILSAEIGSNPNKQTHL